MVYSKRENRILNNRRKADYVSIRNGRPLFEEITDDYICNCVVYGYVYAANHIETSEELFHIYGEPKNNDNILGGN